MARNNPQAALINGPGVRVTLSLTTDVNIQQTTQTYNVGNSVTPTLNDLSVFASAWLTANLVAYQNVQTGATTFSQLSVAEIWYAMTPTYVANIAGGTVGLVAGNPYPLETSVSAVWRTALRGQHGRGRIQFPNVPLGFVTPATDANQLNAAAVTAYLALLAALAAPITTAFGVWTPCVQQRPVPPAVVSQRATYVNAYTLNHFLGTQRRRKAGRGI